MHTNTRVHALPHRAQKLYEQVKDLPIISPHGHCDPVWFASNKPFPDPATLLIVPDHYVLRMLYSQGVSLNSLGIGIPQEQRNPREIFQLFADHWHCFLGTPSREWLEHTLYQVLNVSCELNPETANTVFDEIAEKLQDPNFTPRTLFDQFNIEVLATTDSANDQLEDHQTIKASGWSGRIIPTFRPDSVLNPAHADYQNAIEELAQLSNRDLSGYSNFLQALQERRLFFKTLGATATDHAVANLTTDWLERHEVEKLHVDAFAGKITPENAIRYYGHLLVEMAQMSVEDGMVMQIHAGSVRDTNQEVSSRYGSDMGCDIPKAFDWVHGLNGLLNRAGNNPKLRLIAFTLDEGTYARELAPLAGHWPCLRLGPPWWFHDSPNGMKRYFDQVVETAGYYNLAGFNDDTRAFLSIPARHDTWRMAVAGHLSEQIDNGRFTTQDAASLARHLCYESAVESYRLNDERA